MDTPLTAAQKRRLRRKKSKKRTTGDDEGPDAAVNGPTVADGGLVDRPFVLFTFMNVLLMAEKKMLAGVAPSIRLWHSVCL